MKRFNLLLLLLILLYSNTVIAQKADTLKPVTNISLIVLGTIQDAGSPQIGCTKDCCKKIFLQPDKGRMVVSLGLVDTANNKKYIFEATPDFTLQAKLLKKFSAGNTNETPDGIFLTHAHIGHYTGLMYLGKEAMNAGSIPVYAMPCLKNFLEQNGPWSQLVQNKNIALLEMNNKKTIPLANNLKVIPFTVPHRDEFSETVGYTIAGPNKKALFIPDIDKWQKWDTDIAEAIAKVDYAFIDGTFYDAAEINNRDISTIPHPFIIESMNLFKGLPAAEKKKIYFIHFNHTNPVINTKSRQYRQVVQNGFNVAAINMVFPL
ncbi:MAG: MBL fold metallo-hydrolase [Ferruginibacter sp.]|nr:MBL fold metallo-hydrolase [Ferruginibacter sp.]